MICMVCSREFEAKRKDARFCSASCRKKFSRVTDNTPPVTDNVPLSDTAPTLPPLEEIKAPTPDPTVPPTEPNWKRNGFPSADHAMLYSIALTMKRVPEAVVTWKNKAWNVNDFSKSFLNS